MLTTRGTMEQAFAYITRHYHRLPVSFMRAKNSFWLVTNEGKEVLDMLALYSALCLGHKGNSRILEAVLRQYDLVGMLPGNVFSPIQADCAQALCEFSGMDKVLFMNSGGEAFDTAVKIARKWGYLNGKGSSLLKAKIVVARNNFHGRTLAAISASDNKHYRQFFEPLDRNFYWVDFNDPHGLDKLADADKNIVAFIVEPVQIEGGINIPEPGYLRKVREICSRHNILFVLDEIQTGFGRTGFRFAWQRDGDYAKPDMILLGKALGGGVYPISAVAGSSKAMGVLEPGEHGSTFGGNPLACTAALATIKIFREDPSLIKNSKNMGEVFLGLLRGRLSGSKKVKEIRGSGLLIGIELALIAGNPEYYQLRLLDEGVLCGVARDNVLRFSPPLTIGFEDIKFAVSAIERCLR